MNYKMIGRFLSQILMIESVFMLPALIISLCYGEMVAVNSFLLTLAIGLAFAGVLYGICHRAGRIFGALQKHYRQTGFLDPISGISVQLHSASAGNVCGDCRRRASGSDCIPAGSFRGG